METLSIDDINKLQAENEMITKQYNSLLKQYNEVLRLAKENADANEFCLQELERKLQPFQDEYFNGLTEEQIAELAKKSIRITKENTKLEDALEDISKKLDRALDTEETDAEESLDLLYEIQEEIEKVLEEANED